LSWVTALEADRGLTLSYERASVTRGAVVEVVPLKWACRSLNRILDARLSGVDLTHVLIRVTEADWHRLTRAVRCLVQYEDTALACLAALVREDITHGLAEAEPLN
jgi:hypothetical protein